MPKKMLASDAIMVGMPQGKMNVVMRARLMVESEHACLAVAAALPEAVKLVQLRHHALCCWANERHATLHFVADPSECPPQVLRVEYEQAPRCGQASVSQWEREMLHYRFEGLDHRALFGVVLVVHPQQQLELVLAMCHAIADAQSCLYVLRDLLVALDTTANTATTSEPQAATTRTTTALAEPPPNLYELVPRSLRGLWAFFFKGQLGEVRATLAKEKLHSPLAWDPVDTGQSDAQAATAAVVVGKSCHVVRRVLSADVLGRVRQRAKEHGVTVSSVLAMAMTYARRELLEANAAHWQRAQRCVRDGQLTFCINTTVEARRRIRDDGPLPPDLVANLSVGITTEICLPLLSHPTEGSAPPANVDAAAFFTHATLHHANVQAALVRKAYCAMVSLSTVLPASFLKKAVESMEDKPVAPVTVGNLGVLDDAELGSLAVMRCESISYSHHNFLRAVYAAAVTFCGVMELSFCSSSVRLEDIEAEADHTMRVISSLAQ